MQWYRRTVFLHWRILIDISQRLRDTSFVTRFPTELIFIFLLFFCSFHRQHERDECAKSGVSSTANTGHTYNVVFAVQLAAETSSGLVFTRTRILIYLTTKSTWLAAVFLCFSYRRCTGDSRVSRTVSTTGKRTVPFSRPSATLWWTALGAPAGPNTLLFIFVRG